MLGIRKLERRPFRSTLIITINLKKPTSIYCYIHPTLLRKKRKPIQPPPFRPPTSLQALSSQFRCCLSESFGHRAYFVTDSLTENTCTLHIDDYILISWFNMGSSFTPKCFMISSTIPIKTSFPATNQEKTKVQSVFFKLVLLWV